MYTIAIVQNSQALQYDQMHSALQTARNQASLEMPLRAKELLTAHFNLAVLADQKDVDISPDAQKPAATTQDAELSASAPDEQTYIKIPSKIVLQGGHTPQEQLPLPAEENTNLSMGYQQVTSLMTLGTIFLILMSIHTHSIVPLLTLHPWRNSPRRGREQQQSRQNNNTNVRTGHAPYSRPWDNQPYGRRTRSQQALHARAYRKIQRRYPIQ